MPTLLSPPSLDRHKALRQRLRTYDLTADELKAGFEDVAAHEEEIRAYLNGKKLKELAPNGAGRMNKGEVVDAIYNQILGQYTIGTFSWSPFSEKKMDAMRRHITNTTDEIIQKEKAEQQERIAEQKRILENPQSLTDFRRHMDLKRIKDTELPTEMRAKYDELVADQIKEQRKVETEKKAVVQSVELGQVAMEIVETKHTKQGHDLFVVKLSERVGADTFKELTQKARLMRGNYSSYARDGAVAGFQFRTREDAERFMGLKDGDVSTKEIKEQRQEEVKENIIDRLRDLAGGMTDRAEESLGRDRKDNTFRRANMAASAEEKARSELAMAETLKNIASVIESGEAKHLASVRARADIETLDSVLRRAHYLWADHESKNGGGRFEDLRQAPISGIQIDFAEYPYPFVHRENALNLAKAAAQISGGKRAAAQLVKYAEEAIKADKWNVLADSKHVRETLYNAALAAEGVEASRYTAQSVLETFKDFNRLERMGFVNLPSLRAGLREYIQHRGIKAEADKTKQLERGLIGMKIDGFFPTPQEVIDRMLEAAEIQSGDEVLEPSAGKGDIADAIKHAEPEAVLTVNEVVPTLANVLKEKGYTEDQLRHGDFLQMNEEERTYNKIVMNPPFEKGQDMEHVCHAYKLLKPEGRIVAIVSEGAFFRSDSKSVEFRKWLNDVGGHSEKLPDGSFKDAFRSTGVSTRLVVINKAKAEVVALQPKIETIPVVNTPIVKRKAEQLSLF